MPKFPTKNPWLRYFWAGIWKRYCHTWNQHPPICLMAKFFEKARVTKLGTENALFGYFLGKNLNKNYCHNWYQHPQICLFGKFHEKLKMPKFGTKSVWFRYFSAGFELNIVIFEIRTLQFVQWKNFSKKKNA